MKTAYIDRCECCGQLAYVEPMVSIPASEYRDLLARPASPSGKPFMGKPSRSIIARDPELADFIVQLTRSGDMVLRDIIAVCVGRFGRDRVPSRTAVHRYIQETAKGAQPLGVLSRSGCSVALAN